MKKTKLGRITGMLQKRNKNGKYEIVTYLTAPTMRAINELINSKK
jgi:hypothetical protein